MDFERLPRLTYKVNLPGGQGRLRDAILYVADKYRDAERFGLVKLNKTIWKADFDAFRERQQPVTGRQYKRQKDGPVPYEMRPLLNDMLYDEDIEIERRPIAGLVEQRVIPKVALPYRNFSPADLAFLDRAIRFYWDFTGTEASDHSHGVAWSTRENGDDMPYELSYLSDDKLDSWEERYFGRLAAENNWHTY
ncbi:Panacea domain-containing protein [Sphingomonas sp.]|uniref:Panacea domain-containing protein n=1 Tax=Sphingomonas sp. TaxID=28214 RepID=UPI003B00E53F